MNIKPKLMIATAAGFVFAASATAQTTAPAAAPTTMAPSTMAPTTMAPTGTVPATTTVQRPTAPQGTTATATAMPQTGMAPATPAASTAAPTMTIGAALATLPNRATLAKLVTAANLQATFAGPGPFTVFAPSDEAFSRLPAGALDTLMKPESAATLTTILKYHVVPGALTADQLKAKITAGGGKATLTTLAGQPLIAGLGPNGNIELTDTAGIKSYVDTADIKETNGVVHLTNGMSVPKLG